MGYWQKDIAVKMRERERGIRSMLGILFLVGWRIVSIRIVIIRGRMWGIYWWMVGKRQVGV
jgi:hypothetical protein